MMWKGQTVAQVGQVSCGPQKALCTCCCEEVAFVRAVLVGLGGSQTREGPEVAGGGGRGVCLCRGGGAAQFFHLILCFFGKLI